MKEAVLTLEGTGIMWTVEILALMAVWWLLASPLVQAGEGAQTNQTASTDTTWKFLGPYDGDVYSVVVDPTATSTIYTAGLYPQGPAGIYKSTDAGQTWSLKEIPYFFFSVLIAIHRSQPNILYVGGHDGMAKSLDGGESWVDVSEGLPRCGGSHRPVLDPVDTSTLITDGGLPGGIYNSTDGGAKWYLSSIGLPPGFPNPCGYPSYAGISDIAQNVKNPNEIYAAVPNTPNFSDIGIYKTIDYTGSWFKIPLEFIITALSIDPNNPQTIYAGSDLGDVLKSTDGGSSWTRTITPLSHVRCITVDSKDSNKIYACGGATQAIQSTDGGTTWSPINDGLPYNSMVYALAISQENKIYAATSRGVYVLGSALPLTGLAFPLKGTRPDTDEKLDPYTAPINSVFDHSMKDIKGKYGIYTKDRTVIAYTEEKGERKFGVKAGDCYKQRSKQPFYINGNYTAAGLGTQYLCYDGHPGIDYRASDGTEVYAATSGIVRYPQNIVGIRRPRGAAYKKFHVLELIPDGFPDFEIKIYYLHLSTHPSTGESVEKEDRTSGCPPVVNLPLPEGTHVNAGCLIALSGEAGSPGSPHLHFEVQKVVPIDQVKEEARKSLQCIDDEDKACVPVDLYGWDDDSPDPYESLTGVGNDRLWAHRPVVNRLNPTLVPTGVFDLTITGEGFDPTVIEKIIRQSDFTEMPPGIIRSRSSTQLVVQENFPPGTYFVHVENSDGRQSNWRKLVVE